MRQDEAVHPDDDQVLRRRQERLLAILKVVRREEERVGGIAEGEWVSSFISSSKSDQSKLCLTVLKQKF